MVNYAASFIGLLVLVLCEQAWLRWRRGRSIDWLNMTANLNSGHLMMWLGRGLEVAAYMAVLEHASLDWVPSWPIAAQWIFGLFAWDFFFYLMHRLHHAVPLLWKVHRIHHGGTEMSLSLAIRNSWFSSLTDCPFMLPLAALGLPVHIFLSVSALHCLIQFLNHVARDVVDHLGWLDRILVTPSNHRSHHGLQKVYHNCNFGSTFLCWDRLFGTYQPELEELPALYGLEGATPVNNPAVLNIPGLAKYFRRARMVPIPPGWIGAGGLLLFCLVAYAVDRGAEDGQVLLVAGIILGSIALGAAADSVPFGLEAWTILAAGFTAWVGVYAPQPLALGLSMLLLGHGACSTALLTRR